VKYRKLFEVGRDASIVQCLSWNGRSLPDKTAIHAKEYYVNSGVLRQEWSEVRRRFAENTDSGVKEKGLICVLATIHAKRYCTNGGVLRQEWLETRHFVDNADSGVEERFYLG